MKHQLFRDVIPVNPKENLIIDNVNYEIDSLINVIESSNNESVILKAIIDYSNKLIKSEYIAIAEYETDTNEIKNITETGSCPVLSLLHKELKQNAGNQNDKISLYGYNIYKMDQINQNFYYILKAELTTACGALIKNALQKITLLRIHNLYKKSLSDLNHYEIKMGSNSKYSAVGEFVAGLTDEILEPLQVILSSAELLDQENAAEETNLIKIKAKEIYTVVQRILKFSAKQNNVNEHEICNINNIIREFYSVIKSSLINSNIETFIDLEEGLPEFIGKVTLLNRLFANVFSLLDLQGKKGEGLLIQTKRKNNSIIINIVSSGLIEENGDDSNRIIIDKIISKLNGNIKIISVRGEGTKIEISLKINKAIL